MTQLGKGTNCRAEPQQAIVCVFTSVFGWRKISNIIEGLGSKRSWVLCFLKWHKNFDDNLLASNWSPHGLVVMALGICAKRKGSNPTTDLSPNRDRILNSRIVRGTRTFIGIMKIILIGTTI
uniref:Uncharacterized protein n=1 Tax=Glossina austeni TaxID=7395 RepID=A0A1A9VIN0_GLOAU